MKRVCHFYQAGSCRNEDSCPYFHPSVKCWNFDKNGWCPYGYHCTFWHDPMKQMKKGHQLPRNECSFYINGQCKFGEHCNFSHDINSKNSGRTLSEYQSVNQKLKVLKISPDPHRDSSVKYGMESDFSLNDVSCNSVDGSLFTPVDFDVKTLPQETLKPSVPDVAQHPSVVANVVGKSFHRPVFQPPNQPSTSVNIEAANDSEIGRLQALEINRLLKWLPKEKLIDDIRTQEGRIFILQFSSTDPDWAYVVREVTLNVRIDLMYPKKPLDVTVSQEGCLPAVLVEHLNTTIATWIQNQHGNLEKTNRVGIYLRQLLQWLDRNLEELFTEGLRKYKSQLLNGNIPMNEPSCETEESYAETTSIHSLNGDDQKQHYLTSDSDEDVSVGSSQRNSSTEIDDENVLGSSDDIVGFSERVKLPNSTGNTVHTTDSTKSHETQQNETAISHKSEIPATHTLRLADMRLVGSTSIYVQSRLYASMHCTRCRQPFGWYFNFHGSLPQSLSSKDTTSLPTAHMRSLPPHKLACTRCHHPIALFFQSTIAHSFENLVGAFHLAGCVVDDIPFGQSSCVLVCSNCHQYIKVKMLFPDRGVKRRCFSCHALIGLEFSRFLLESRIRSDDTATSGSVPVKKDKSKADVSRKQDRSLKASQSSVIKDGFPLPFFGACEHYRKSYRWLRLVMGHSSTPCTAHGRGWIKSAIQCFQSL